MVGSSGQPEAKLSLLRSILFQNSTTVFAQTINDDIYVFSISFFPSLFLSRNILYGGVKISL
jgi:hypothetical protein